MLKYVDARITFAEIPDEVTLCINITGCKNKCRNCHSPYLAEDTGTELIFKEILELCDKNKGISCISFMGGDNDPSYINKIAKMLKKERKSIKIAWYSGKDILSEDIDVKYFDYIKIGSYREELGPLNSELTNQRMYKVINGELKDVTNKFWK